MPDYIKPVRKSPDSRRKGSIVQAACPPGRANGNQYKKSMNERTAHIPLTDFPGDTRILSLE